MLVECIWGMNLLCVMLPQSQGYRNCNHNILYDVCRHQTSDMMKETNENHENDNNEWKEEQHNEEQHTATAR